MSSGAPARAVSPSIATERPKPSPAAASTGISLKVEVTHDEPVLLPAPPRAVRHLYDEPFEAEIRTYGLEEICAEKLRAAVQQARRLPSGGFPGRDA